MSESYGNQYSSKKPPNITKIFLQLEGLSVFIFSIISFFYVNGNWILFFLFLLFPDIFALGYLKNDNIGAIIYNIGHIYLDPILIGLLGIIFSNTLLIELGLIWLAHISMDRVFGYGLKLTTGFKHTHLQEI